MGRVLSGPPLAGIRVIEIGNYMAGPFCGMHLADLGAEVIKVENPKGGDLTRQLQPFQAGESGSFLRLNRGKRSLALDLKRPRGADIFRRLSARADVVLENLRPGTMADLGLSSRSLMDANERLVYVAVSGWGQSGPYADRPALDLIVQAESGLMSVTGEKDGAPVKVGVSIADLSSALYATVGTLAALRARDADGRGQLVDISMFESAVSLAVWESGQFFTDGAVARANGSAHNFIAPYQAVRSSDGHFVIGPTSAPNWTAFLRVLGLEELAGDPRFTDGPTRKHNVDALIPLIEAVTVTNTTAHWLAGLREAGVPCATVRDYGSVLEDPHLSERGFLTDIAHPTLGSVRATGSAIGLTRTPPVVGPAGPALGADSRDVLRELGCAPGDIAALIEEGTVLAT
ncbi:MAG: CoA transferase [Chloroflexi bacterium]|nr:CoA transferase [Chloroflexota bacterium]